MRDSNLTSATKEELLRILRSIAISSNPFSLPLILQAQKSTSIQAEEHPLGMFVVYFRQETFTLRLHIWKPSTSLFRDGLGTIHDHIWDLESYVLRGTISHRVFDLAKDNDGVQLWGHDYESQRIHKLEESVLPILRTEKLIPAGGRYFLPAGEFHQTEPMTDLAITLVKATPTKKTVARILDGSASSKTRPKVMLDRILETLAYFGSESERAP